MRKIPLAGIELTSQRVRGLRGTSELPGQRANLVSEPYKQHNRAAAAHNGSAAALLFRAGHDLHIEHRFGAMIIEQQDVQHRIMREQYSSEPWGEPYRSGLGTVRATFE